MEGLLSRLLRQLDAPLVTCGDGKFGRWWEELGGGGRSWAVRRGVVLRGPDDIVGRRVGIGHAREHCVRAADVPVVVVALDGHGGRVWKTQRDKDAANQIRRSSQRSPVSYLDICRKKQQHRLVTFEIAASFAPSPLPEPANGLRWPAQPKLDNAVHLLLRWFI